MCSIGEGLNITMIRDGNGTMSILCCLLNNICYIRNTIHIRHLGMTMQFYTLKYSVIASGRSPVTALHDSANTRDNEFMHEGV